MIKDKFVNSSRWNIFLQILILHFNLKTRTTAWGESSQNSRQEELIQFNFVLFSFQFQFVWMKRANWSKEKNDERRGRKKFLFRSKWFPIQKVWKYDRVFLFYSSSFSFLISPQADGIWRVLWGFFQSSMNLCTTIFFSYFLLIHDDTSWPLARFYFLKLWHA